MNLSYEDIFFLKAERGQVKRDEFDRVIPPLEQEHYAHPRVSEKLWNDGFKPVYPKGHSFACCISHDVDWLYRNAWPIKSVVNQQLKALTAADRNKWQQNRLLRKRHREPHFDLQQTLRHYLPDMKGTFYFMALQKGDQDFNYTVEEVHDQFDLLKEQGCEIGLHGGHTAYKDHLIMKTERQRLQSSSGAEVTGYRNHYLRWDPDTSWKCMQDAAFHYDATFGWAQWPGFRNGMCHPFQAFTADRGALDLVVLPLHLMDVSLWEYGSHSMEVAFEEACRLIDEVAAVNGVFTLLWHNNYMHEEKGELFSRILKYLADKDPWFATGEEVCEWYVQKKYTEQICERMGYGKK